MNSNLIIHEDPKSPISEIFRTLRTNIQFMNTTKNTKTILVTSAFPGEGKSWVSANLATTFAQTGKKVILIDSDMRKGKQYSILGVLPAPGLSNYLAGVDIEYNMPKARSIKSYIQKTAIDNLDVMTAGNIPPNPSELLTSMQMTQLLEKVKKLYDIVIVDGTPCQLVTDSLIIAGMVDSTIIVVLHKSTKKKDLQKVITGVNNVGGKISGVILNKIPVKAKKYEQSYYYGSSSAKEFEAQQAILNEKFIKSTNQTTVATRKRGRPPKAKIQEIKQNVNEDFRNLEEDIYQPRNVKITSIEKQQLIGKNQSIVIPLFEEVMLEKNFEREKGGKHSKKRLKRNIIA